MLKNNVHPLDASRKSERKKFVDVLWNIYAPLKRKNEEMQHWVPPLRVAVEDSLDTLKHPFYKHADIQLWIALRNGHPVGRIAAIENRAHNKFHNDTVGFYGFFESIDDQEVANQLFATARQWLEKRGLTSMLGPVNPSTNYECGLLVRGQSQHPTVMTSWNPRYYVQLFENAGLKNAKDTVAYALVPAMQKDLSPKVIKRIEKIRKNTKFVFRDFDMKNYDREVEICYEIYNSAWEKNWGFVPTPKEEFIYLAKDMKMIIDPRWAFIAERDGVPAGFMLALPDINYILKRIPNGRLFPTGLIKLLIGKKKINTVRILTLGVKEEFRGSGIFALFTQEAMRRAKAYGVRFGEASWILEDNKAMNKPWQALGAPQYRRWRFYAAPTSALDRTQPVI